MLQRIRTSAFYQCVAHPSVSAWLAYLITAALLVLGVPLFLRMPPWCDLTLYDIAARNIMTGGVHYRDVFDTNLPGFVWLLVGIRRTLGPGVEVVRAVDLAIVAASTILIGIAAKRCGATRAGIAWFAAGVAAFYPFTTEFCHAQRDVWMLLPVLVAVRLRANRTVADADSRTFQKSLREGILWGFAVWIKPHVVIMATAVWLVSFRRIARNIDGKSWNWRTARLDYLGNLLGGILVGILGVAWLFFTDALSSFEEVFTKWNGQYMSHVFSMMSIRAEQHLFYFLPWSFWQPLGILIAILDLFGLSLRRTERDEHSRTISRMMSALYLSWIAQGFILQKHFHYVHVPETLLFFGLLVAHRLTILIPLGLIYLAVCGSVQIAYQQNADFHDRMDGYAKRIPNFWECIPKHPLANLERTRQWASCLQVGLPLKEYRARQDSLALEYGGFPSIAVAEIGEIADHLRELGVRDGELICWHDSPHAVYLELNNKPIFRFMHVNTTLVSQKTYYRMKRELVKFALPKAKYIVTDLIRVYVTAPPEMQPHWVDAGPDFLPASMTAKSRACFPYNQPAIFRSGGGTGRYVIHRLVNPVAMLEYEVDIWDNVLYRPAFQDDPPEPNNP